MNMLNQFFLFVTGLSVGLGYLGIAPVIANQDNLDQKPLNSSITDDAETVPKPTTAEFAQILAQLGEPPADLEEPSQSEGPGSPPRLKRQPDSPNDALFRPRSDIFLERSSRYAPSITLLTPSAFGKDWRQYSVGVGFQERTRFSNSSDGAVGVGFGLGDSRKLVGLDIGITFTDLSAFFDSGIVSFKLHRRLKSDLAIAVGVNDALTWGSGDVDGPSPYGAISKIFRLRKDTQAFMSQISVSAGVGTGRYRSETSIFNGNDDPNPFGSIALRVFDPVNVITEWSGQDLSVGLSVRPIRKIPFVITPAVTDLTGSAGDGTRFLLGVGYSSRF